MEYIIKCAEIGDKIIISKLLQPYLSELAQFEDIRPDQPNASGEYEYQYLESYWTEKDRYPYLFYLKEKLAGLAFVRKEENYYSMAEFYILPEFRRLGLGMAFAIEIFKKHTGVWKIGFNKQNIPSRQLWKKLAQNLAHSDVEEGETDISHDYISFSV